MERIENPYFMTGLQLADIPTPSTDSGRPTRMLKNCPAHGETPLLNGNALANDLNIRSLTIKDERNRMGLGSFKALGAAYVIASDAAMGDVSQNTYVSSSAGNHGLLIRVHTQYLFVSIKPIDSGIHNHIQNNQIGAVILHVFNGGFSA